MTDRHKFKSPDVRLLNPMKRTLATAFLCLLLATPVWAGSFEEAIRGFGRGMDAYGRGDFAEAVREFRYAALHGSSDAQYFLGEMLNAGTGVPKDYVEARKWYTMSAARGYAPAQYNLGVLYDYGRGGPQDYVEARKWYGKAAAQGLAEAQNSLGSMYGKGQGGLQDYVEAHKWYNLAATQGDKLASKNRDIIAKKMTPADISKAQKLAREWLAAFQKRKGK